MNPRGARRAFVAFAIATTLSVSALADEPSRASWVEADLGLAVVGAAYEHVANPVLSLRAAGGFTRAWYTKGDPSGFYGELRPFVFVGGRAPAGFYLSPFARVAQIRAKRGDAEGTGTGWTAGATAGYGWVFGRLLVRAGVGAQLWRFEVDTSAGRAGLRGVLPDIDAIVGYGF